MEVVYFILESYLNLLIFPKKHGADRVNYINLYNDYLIINSKYFDKKLAEPVAMQTLKFSSKLEVTILGSNSGAKQQLIVWV